LKISSYPRGVASGTSVFYRKVYQLTGKYRWHIITQIGVIDNFVDHFDHGWIESEKVRRILPRQYRYKPESPANPLLTANREKIFHENNPARG
jgi:hypothetical protein